MNGLYQVSNLGRVKSLIFRNGKTTFFKERILKHGLNRYGYEFVILCKNNKRKTIIVHRLVAKEFIGDENKLEINHINGIKSDNRLENLEYVSHKENILHAYKNKLETPKYKKIDQFDKNNNFIKQWDSMKSIVDELKIDYGLLSRCCHKKNKTAGGFIWRFST